MVGGELELARSDGDVGTYQAVGVRALAGYGYAMRRDCDLLAAAYVGYARAGMQLDSTAAGAPSLDLTGDEQSWGLLAEATWLFAPHWSVWGGVGWRAAQSELDGDGHRLELDQDGITVGIGIGYRIAMPPRRLEE